MIDGESSKYIGVDLIDPQVMRMSGIKEPDSANKTVKPVEGRSFPRVAISMAEKEEIENQNRIRLEQQMLVKDLEFGPGPQYALVQFSNYCNMSCIMCWNSNNPRTVQLTAKLVELIGSQLGPHVSVMEPYSGSEPLVLTWQETRDMAKEYGIQLILTTNAQTLDEQTFDELKDITRVLNFSIDCHIPEVFEKIRVGAHTDIVFENVIRSARLARENRIECVVNLVLMTFNAPFLPETIQFFHDIGIDSVNIIQMNDVNKRSYYFDAVRHCSVEYLSWLKTRTIDVGALESDADYLAGGKF